jgi:hypothetical protein
MFEAKEKILNNSLIDHVVAEMKQAWLLVRKEHPTDSEADAQRILKNAFTKLNSDPNAVIQAERLREVYAEIR